MITHDELYAGFPKETAEAWRSEAMERWGKEKVEQSEQVLRQMSKEDIEKLREEGSAITAGLIAHMHRDVSDPEVQQLVHRHYLHILQWWGRKTEEDALDAYKGLSNLYLMDERYTYVDGKPNLAFTAFLTRAMLFYVDALAEKQ